MEPHVFYFIVFLLILTSAICSGLNISLMSLDAGDLKRKAKLGNVAAKRLLPLRQKSHLTLAAILLTNVAAVSATSLVLEHEFNGIIAGIASTLLIVIFGEIFPQALFNKDPLKWCNRFWWLLKIMIFVTYAVSRPLQILLDRLFGQEKNKLHSRDELGIIISEHLGTKKSELDTDEVEIVQNALLLSEKRVQQIMTPIERTYWLTPDTLIDEDKIDEIKAVGRSRIPIFNKKLTVCYGVLLMKDLVDIDFDSNPQQVDELPLYPAQMVGSRTALDTMFRKFITAHTHLIPIERDDKIVGIATIEDIVEEILGHEIFDESDRQPKVVRFRRKKTTLPR